MIGFKLYLEMIEPRKPDNKVTRQTIIKDKGTNVAKKVTQYSWKTRIGNIVKLQFQPTAEKEYFVIFYVNDVLFDYGSKLMGTHRDPEILPTVFYLLKSKANALKATRLTFSAHKSERDTKIIKNLDLEPWKSTVLEELSILADEMENYQIKMIEPSQTLINLYAKLNKPKPKPYPDFKKDIWLKWIKQLIHSIETNQSIENFIDEILTAKGIGEITVDPKLINNLKQLSNAIESNSPRGFRRESNRRLSIYKRIIERDFSKEWDIQIDGTRFTLTRLS